MWMMGYNEPHDDHINMVEAYTNNGSRKLRPLVPRPPPPTCAAASSSNRFHPTHHQHLVASEQNKREFNSQQMVVVSSRWNPTPEQLQTLEDLYRRGTRTPSADEIQHITAQLRRFGKIEGKNVFYWFQNHKARERQKRRRQLDNNPTNDLNHQQTPFFTNDINTINLDEQPIIQTKHSEVEETRNWAIPTFSEKSMLREKTGKSEYRKPSDIAGDQRWIQQEQEEGVEDEEEENDEMMMIHHRRRKSIPARNATWSQMMQCLSTPCTNHITLINSTTTPTTTTIPTTTSDVDNSYETLELFPVNTHRDQPEKCFVPTSDVSLSPRQFIEFLPLKN